MIVENVDQEVNGYSTFKITLWKVDPNEPAIILAEQKIEVTRDVYVLKNKIHFSQDGKYIYLVLLEKESRSLWKTIVFDAIELKHAYELDFDLRNTNVNGKHLKIPILNLIFRLIYQARPANA